MPKVLGMEEESIRLTPMEKDTLKEVSNLGSAKATNTLSAIIGRPVKLTVPYIQLIPIERITSFLGGPHEVLACTPIQIFSQKKAVLIIIFKRKTASALVELMNKQAGRVPKKLEEMDVSPFIELAHILNNAYLNPLANFFDEKFSPENTQIVLDASAIAGQLIGQINSDIKYGLVIGTDFLLPGEKEVEGKFILFIDELGLRALLEALDRRMLVRKGKIF